MAGFRNPEHADGTYSEEGGKYAVYDGAKNWMGCIRKDGSFTGDGAATEYKASYLRAARAELIRLGLVEGGGA